MNKSQWLLSKSINGNIQVYRWISNSRKELLCDAAGSVYVFRSEAAAMLAIAAA